MFPITIPVSGTIRGGHEKEFSPMRHILASQKSLTSISMALFILFPSLQPAQND